MILDVSYDEMFDLARENRIPLIATMELTTMCNFKCMHCYQDNKKIFMPKSKAIDLIDTLTERGCVFLNFTGGEPLLHPDFDSIYSYAYNKGLKITIQSNASLITKEVMELFIKHPPRKFEITLYGVDEESYAEFTGNPNGYLDVMNALKMLCDHGFHVILKAFINEVTIKNAKQIKAIASRFGCELRIAHITWPTLNQDRSPLERQIAISRLDEFVDESHYKEIKDLQGTKVGDELFTCEAGRSSVYISSELDMKMCVFDTFSNKSLEQSSFEEIWQSFSKYHQLRIDKESKCYNCDDRAICGICPAWSHMMYGDFKMNNASIFCDNSKELRRLMKGIEGSQDDQ